MREHLVNFLDNFWLSGKPATRLVTILILKERMAPGSDIMRSRGNVAFVRNAWKRVLIHGGAEGVQRRSERLPSWSGEAGR